MVKFKTSGNAKEKFVKFLSEPMYMKRDGLFYMYGMDKIRHSNGIRQIIGKTWVMCYDKNNKILYLDARFSQFLFADSDYKSTYLVDFHEEIITKYGNIVNEIEIKHLNKR